MHDSTRTAASASTDRRLADWAMVFGALAWMVPFLVSTETTLRLTREDGPYETVGAIAFFVAGVVFAALFTRTWRSDRNWWFLALAVLFLFAAGEEISWGQRLLGWGEVDRSTNVQGETTLHNLGIFDTVQGGWLKFPRLFFLFWSGWLLLAPMLTRLIAPVRRAAASLRLPVPPLLFGLVMLANLVLSKTYGPLGVEEGALERAAEIRECAQAVALLAVAFSFWLRPLSREPLQPISASVRPDDEAGLPAAT